MADTDTTLFDQVDRPIIISPVPRITLRRKDAAIALGISERALSYLAEQGKIPCFRPPSRTGAEGTAVLFLVSDLQAWAERMRSATEGAST
jgi:hypothetical protein